MRLVLPMLCATLLLVACAPKNNDRFDTRIPPNAVLIDVRTEEEFASGYYPGAINIPHDRILEGLSARSVGLDTPLVLYCRSGNRSSKAVAALNAAGFLKPQNAGDLQTLLTVHQQTLVTPEEPLR
jgi:phage shock protein E